MVVNKTVPGRGMASEGSLCALRSELEVLTWCESQVRDTGDDFGD